MDDVKKGTGPVYESILEINPALAGQLKQVNSLTDAWDIFAKAIKQADLEQSNKLARSVFGRSGVEITRLARANSDAGGLAGLTAQLQEVDRITGKQAERWDELGDKIAENTTAARQNIVSIFADPVLTATEKFSSGLLEASRTAKNFSMSEDLQRYMAFARSGVAAIPIIGPAISAGAATAGALSSRSGAPAAAPSAPSFVDKWGDTSTGPAVGIDTARLEVQKRALAATIAEQERWNTALGAAVTPAENLKLGLDKLKLAQMENKISAEQAAKGQAALNAQYSSTQFSTYIGLLGQAASIEDQVRAKRNQINDAARQGVSLTKEQIAVQLELTRTQALGTFQIDAATAAERVHLAAMFMSNEAATAYTIVQTKINEARARGAPLKAQEVADLQKSAEAYAKVKTQADAYGEALNSVASSASSTLTTGLTDILDGTKSVGQGFQDMSKMIIRAVEEAIIKMLIVQPIIQSLKSSLSGGFSIASLFGGGGGITPSAHGNIFDAGNVVPFARGGVVSQPTVFPMAQGMGLMGEAGPEAVMPLRRGPDGNLGVMARDGGGSVSIGDTNIVINGQRTDGEIEQIRAELAAHRNIIAKQVKEGRRGQHLSTTGVGG
jgi:lambda family phage tail tape measure protein